MNYKRLFLFILLDLTSSYMSSQIFSSRVEIVQPSMEQEATSIWQTIKDIAFFEEQGYKIHLPDDPLIDSLSEKSKKGTFGNEDFEKIYSLVATKIHNPKNYEKARKKILRGTGLVHQCIEKINSLKNGWDWNFKSFEVYRVRLTLYGTGGSYDPIHGNITVLTNEKGEFVSYENPANTIVHEIAHIGMEHSIMQKYNIPHSLKERLVDLFVYILFKNELPNYKIQPMGESTINELIKEKKDINTLNKILSEFFR